MARSYFVVSDLHLCDIEEHADGWKAYKSAAHCFDEALAEAVERFLADGDPDTERVLVLNGDIFDFDLVTATPSRPAWHVSLAEQRRGLDATADKSAWKLDRVIVDHPRFIDTLSRVLAAGHRIVYVLGNHDREFHFKVCRDILVEAVVDWAADHNEVVIDAKRFVFEPWFFHEPGEIYVEHGQQYDYYTSFRYILAPVVGPKKNPRIALPMGNLSNRELMSGMGFFNPHATDYILNIYSYFLHWLKYYAFTRRGIAIRWFVGSLVVMLQLLRTKRALLSRPPAKEALFAAYAERTGMPLGTVLALDQLKRLPITNRWYRVIREFWLDRIALTVVMAGGTIALALLPIPLWIKLMVPLSSFPLMFLIYESFAHGETVFSAEHDAIEYAREIAGLVQTKIVTFGHSHTPLTVPLKPGTSYVNTGTWAPVWGKAERTQCPGLRNVLLAHFDGEKHSFTLTSG